MSVDSMYTEIIRDAILAKDFESSLKNKVHMANRNARGDLAPWEAVMAYVIALERRVATLEREKLARKLSE